MKKIILIVITILLIAQSTRAITIGSDTGKIFLPRVLRNGYASKTITLSTDSIDEVIVQPLITGEASQWITIIPGNISLRKDNPAQVKIIVQPPRDIANGNYTAMISFTFMSNQNPSTRIGSKIITSINIPITIEITGIEIKSCDSSTIIIPDIEVNNKPVLRTRILNTGNVRIKPPVKIKILDKEMINTLYEGTIYPDKEVMPTEEETLYYEIPVDLQVGQYWADINIEDCGIQTMISFDVLETGGISDKGSFLRIDYKGKPFKGNILEMFAVFMNKGYRPVTASFEGRIIRNDKVVKLIETPSITINPGKVGYIPFYFKPMETGSYVIKGRVRYNDKLSYERSITINVKEESSNNIYVIIVLVIIAVILAIILRKKYSYRRIHRF